MIINGEDSASHKYGFCIVFRTQGIISLYLFNSSLCDSGYRCIFLIKNQPKQNKTLNQDFFFFPEKVFRSPGWPGTHCIGEDDLEPVTSVLLALNAGVPGV